MYNTEQYITCYSQHKNSSIGIVCMCAYLTLEEGKIRLGKGDFKKGINNNNNKFNT